MSHNLNSEAHLDVPNAKASSTLPLPSCLTDRSVTGIGVDQGSFFLMVSPHHLLCN